MREEFLMRGVECAFFGSVGSENIELKTAKSGNSWASFSVGVTVGTLDDGKDQVQWLRISCFGETAERAAASFKKGDRVYCEGNLKLDHWVDTHGEQKHGLSVAAWKAEKVGASALGRNMPKSDPKLSFAGEIHRFPPEHAGPSYQRECPKVQGRNDDYWRDELPI
jgi:single-strand DNA-binding protein